MGRPLSQFWRSGQCQGRPILLERRFHFNAKMITEMERKITFLVEIFTLLASVNCDNSEFFFA